MLNKVFIITDKPKTNLTEVNFEYNEKTFQKKNLMAETELAKSDCLYASCYCEENVYKLVEKMRNSSKCGDLNEIWAVFISNSDRCVPLW